MGEELLDVEVVLWPILVNAAIVAIYFIHSVICILFYGKNFFDYSKAMSFYSEYACMNFTSYRIVDNGTL